MQDLNHPVTHHDLSCFFWKMNRRCPVVVSGYGCHDCACTHLLALGEVMKTPEPMGARFFHFIKSFVTNKKKSLPTRLKPKLQNFTWKMYFFFSSLQKKVSYLVLNVYFFASCNTALKQQITFWKGESCSALQECFVLFFPEWSCVFLSAIFNKEELSHGNVILENAGFINDSYNCCSLP